MSVIELIKRVRSAITRSDFANALSEISKASRRGLEPSEASRLRALVYSSSGQIDNLGRELSRLRKMRPRDREVAHDLAAWNVFNGGNADAALELLAEESDSDVDVAYLRSMALMRLARPKEAAKVLWITAKLSTRNALLRCRCLAASGFARIALRDFKSLQPIPNDPRAIVDLLHGFLSTKTVISPNRLPPLPSHKTVTDIDLALKASELLHHLGDPEAIDYGLRALELEPSGKNLVHVGYLYEMSGDWSRARSLYLGVIAQPFAKAPAEVIVALAETELKYLEIPLAAQRYARQDRLQRLERLVDPAIKSHIMLVREQGIGEECFYFKMLLEVAARLGGPIFTVRTSERLLPLFTELAKPLGGLVNATAFAEKDLERFESDETAFPIRVALALNANKYDDTQLASRPPLPHTRSRVRKLKVAVSWMTYGSKWGRKKTLSPVDVELVLDHCESVGELVPFQFDTNPPTPYWPSRLVRPSALESATLRDNFINTASLLRACDLVVSVSNSFAHLSCLLGLPTIVICPERAGRFFYWRADQSGRAIFYDSAIVLSNSELRKKLPEAIRSFTRE